MCRDDWTVGGEGPGDKERGGSGRRLNDLKPLRIHPLLVLEPSTHYITDQTRPEPTPHPYSSWREDAHPRTPRTEEGEDVESP